MVGYDKYFNSNKRMSFKVIDNELIKKYTKRWERVNNSKNIKFDSEHVYGDNDKYFKTKRKVYGDKINIIFKATKNTKRKCIT